MDIVREAYEELFSEEYHYSHKIRFSRKFKDFNANVRYSANHLDFRLSYKWKTVSRDIVIGLLQTLLLKVRKSRKHTTKTELYNLFMKNIHIAAPKTDIDPVLLESFNRVNETYFYGLADTPNLVWGQRSRRKLGSYEYGSDTITISRILENAGPVLDYVMYHEILHKKHKFRTTSGRSYHHTREFRKDEKKFERWEEAEAQLKNLCRRRIFGIF
ncbi:MAG: hypothetical protein ABH879_01735 [archaeon]